MRITKLTVELDSGDTIDFEKHENEKLGTGSSSVQMQHPERIASSLLEKAQNVADFVMSSKF